MVSEEFKQEIARLQQIADDFQEYLFELRAKYGIEGGSK